MPIDLKAKFGRKYKIVVDESHRAETGSERQVKVDPWNWRILGRRGHVCPWSEEHVAVCIDGHSWMTRALVAHPAVVKVQDGVNAVVRNEDLPQVINFIRPYNRRTTSPEQLARLAAMGFKRTVACEESTLETHAMVARRLPGPPGGFMTPEFIRDNAFVALARAMGWELYQAELPDGTRIRLHEEDFDDTRGVGELAEAGVESVGKAAVESPDSRA